MNWRRFKRCVAVILLIVLLLTYFPFPPSCKQMEFHIDFTTESPSHLLKETIKRLPFYGLLFTLDYMAVEYDQISDKAHITSVSFGFSRYLGFDMYDAICFTYDGCCVETRYMREEAKTIYDELYNAIAYISANQRLISANQRLLSQNIENLTSPFERTVVCILEENASIDYNWNLYIDKQTNTIVFSPKRFIEEVNR